MAGRRARTHAKNQRRRRWLQLGIVFAGLIFFLATSCCVLPIGVSSVYQWGAVRSVPDFDALNESLLNEIPLPAGSTLVTKESDGILGDAYTHGRWLRVGYQQEDYSGSTEVGEHFRSVLVELGYSELSRQLSGSQQYVRDSQCIYILLAPIAGGIRVDHESYDFILGIHVDYRTQSFSPWVPPEWVLPWIGGLKYDEARCP